LGTVRSQKHKFPMALYHGLLSVYMCVLVMYSNKETGSLWS
jgi:hypothetical protein